MELDVNKKIQQENTGRNLLCDLLTHQLSFFLWELITAKKFQLMASKPSHAYFES